MTRRQRVLNAVLDANPWGVRVGAVLGVVIGLLVFT